MGLAAGSGHLRKRTGPRNAALRQARGCYNHLAGDMGTRMFDSLMAKGHLVRNGDDLRLTGAGADSERRSHLAGSLGRAFLSRFEELRWVKRDQKTRIVTFSKTGAEAFERLFSLD